jgi:hypothetical protein
LTEPRTIARTLSLVVRNLVFTVVVPGLTMSDLGPGGQ